MITIGLIWLWLIDLAHSSILSTFRSDPELSWIDWDLSSVTASPESPHFYSETQDSAVAWLPGHDLTLGTMGADGGWSGMTLGWRGVWIHEQYLGNNEQGLGTLRGKVREIGRGLGRGKNSLEQGDVMSLISHQARRLGSDDLLSFFVNKKPAWNECLLIQTKY